MKKQLLLFTICIGFLACKYPKADWENIESESENKLVVFGLISLDETHSSFVDVRRTLSLDEADRIIIGYDTVIYKDTIEVYAITQKADFVKNATVKISDGVNNFSFILDPDKSYWENYYVDTTGTFSPQPNTDYYLTVEAPGLEKLIGVVTTPAFPDIDETSVPDTVYVKKPYSVKYNLNGDFNGMITTGLKEEKNTICGADHYKYLPPNSSVWTTPPVDCSDWWWDTTFDEPDSLFIKLRTVDENYFNYFIKREGKDFVNFLSGDGMVGHAFGVEGGFGVFASFASDKIYRVIVP